MRYAYNVFLIFPVDVSLHFVAADEPRHGMATVWVRCTLVSRDKSIDGSI